MSHSRSRFIASSATLALAIQARSAGAQAPQVIRAAITPINYDAVPMLYALKTGAFAKAGLDVQLQRITSGAAITAAVAGGAIDIGKSSAPPLYTAFARGVPVTIIAPGAIYDAKSPNAGLVVLPNAPYKVPSDLNGQSVALNSINDISQASIEAWFGQNGGDPALLKFVEIPQAAEVAALEEHRIGAALLTSPAFDAAIIDGRVRSIAAPFSAIAPRFLFSAYFTTRDFAGKHRDALKRFSDTLIAAAAYTNAHHTELTATIADLMGVKPYVVEKMNYPIGGMALLAAEVQPVIEIGLRYKLIPTRFAPQDILWNPTS